MGSAIAGGSETSRHPADGVNTARQVFEQAVSDFMARPQRRCNLERLASAAFVMHDAGLAALERCYGRELGSFGGRMAAQALDNAADAKPIGRDASAAEVGVHRDK